MPAARAPRLWITLALTALLSTCVPSLCAAEGCGAALPGAVSVTALPPVAVDRLPVPGHGSAGLVAPADSRPRPLLVVLHGSADRVTWTCGHWGRLVQGRAWVLCPAGKERQDVSPLDPRWTFGPRAAVARELAAAVLALRAKVGARLRLDGAVLAGFSLGAWRAASLATRPVRIGKQTLRWQGLWLHEGGRWPRRFRGRGVHSCGSARCQRRRRPARAARRRGRPEGRRAARYAVWDVPGLGHAYTGVFSAHARPALAQLTHGWPGWAQPHEGPRRAPPTRRPSPDRRPLPPPPPPPPAP